MAVIERYLGLNPAQDAGSRDQSCAATYCCSTEEEPQYLFLYPGPADGRSVEA